MQRSAPAQPSVAAAAGAASEDPMAATAAPAVSAAVAALAPTEVDPARQELRFLDHLSSLTSQWHGCVPLQTRVMHQRDREEANPLVWLASFCSPWPELQSCAARLFGTAVYAAGCERVWSLTGHTYAPRRRSMRLSTLSDQLFSSWNAQYLSAESTAEYLAQKRFRGAQAVQQDTEDAHTTPSSAVPGPVGVRRDQERRGSERSGRV